MSQHFYKKISERGLGSKGTSSEYTSLRFYKVKIKNGQRQMKLLFCPAFNSKKCGGGTWRRQIIHENLQIRVKAVHLSLARTQKSKKKHLNISKLICCCFTHSNLLVGCPKNA